MVKQTRMLEVDWMSVVDQWAQISARLIWCWACFNPSLEIEHTFNKIDLCIDIKIKQYLNRQEVKKALHANTRLYWEPCSRKLQYNQRNRGVNVIPIISDLLKAGLQVAGWTQAYGHTVKGKQESILTYTTIRGGGHEMPYTNPSEALTLYRSFIRALPFPSS